MNILAIESSCDETAVAIIKDGTEIINNVVASSTAMHEKWGGIVPEVAAREQLRTIIPVLIDSLEIFQTTISGKKFSQDQENFFARNYASIIKDDIDAIAVSVGPGLVGSLLIGIETAKAIAYVTNKPIIPVNHVLAHMYANFLKPSQIILFPAISLVVSGGHTELFLMKNEKDLTWLSGTIDDAAGEAFDKTARILGFGNAGGRAIEEAANNTASKQIRLPRPMMYDDTLNFSFSGLKTAIQREWNKFEKHNEILTGAFAHEVQEAITEVLVKKTLTAIQRYNAQSILISGGVASNKRLREKMKEALRSSAIKFFAPDPQYCTDNAAMIGSYAFFRGKTEDWHTITAIPDLSVDV